MIDRHVDIETSDGRMDTFVTHPDQGGPHPAVILYMDAPGIREELYDLARRVGTVGYVCIVPDLYYRLGKKRWDMSKVDDAMRQEYRDAMLSISNGLIMDDTRAMLNFLDKESGVSPGPKGCMGYCMSGSFVLTAAGVFPEVFKATASYHGVRHITDKEDSPHLLAQKFQGELYLGYAEDDPHVPLQEVDALEKVLKGCPVKWQSEVHPGTEHGYSFPLRPAYQKEAAEKNFERTFAMFHRQIPTHG